MNNSFITSHNSTIASKPVVRHEIDLTPILDSIKSIRKKIALWVAGILWWVALNSCNTSIDEIWIQENIPQFSITDAQIINNKQFFKQLQDKADVISYYVSTTQKDTDLISVWNNYSKAAEEIWVAYNNMEQETTKTNKVKEELRSSYAQLSKLKEKSKEVSMFTKVSTAIFWAFAWLVAFSPEILNWNKKTPWQKRANTPNKITRREEDKVTPDVQKIDKKREESIPRNTWNVQPLPQETPRSPISIRPIEELIKVPLIKKKNTANHENKLKNIFMILWKSEEEVVSYISSFRKNIKSHLKSIENTSSSLSWIEKELFLFKSYLVYWMRLDPNQTIKNSNGKDVNIMESLIKKYHSKITQDWKIMNNTISAMAA